MRSSIERGSRSLSAPMRAMGAASALVMLLTLARPAHATVDLTSIRARRSVEARLATHMGFPVSITSPRVVSLTSGRWFFGLVSSSQANRVACSALVYDPSDDCARDDDYSASEVVVVVDPPGDGEDLVAFVVEFDEERSYAADELLDASPLEADGDPARELAVVVRSGRNDSPSVTELWVVDDDGRPIFDKVLSSCEQSEEEQACDLGFASIADEDGDGRAEITYVVGASSDDDIVDRMATSLEGSDDASLEALDSFDSLRYAYDLGERCYVNVN